MPDFNLDNAGKWIKDHKEIVIPAAVVGGVVGLYVLSKGGGFDVGGAAGSDGVDSSGGAGAGGTDAGYGEAIASLQDQLAQSQSQNESGLQSLISQISAIQQQFADALGSLAGQTNDALASQAAQTNDALAALADQQQAYGDNGLGQLLAQLPAYLAPAQNYGQSAIPDYSGSIMGTGVKAFGDVKAAARSTINPAQLSRGTSQSSQPAFQALSRTFTTIGNGFANAFNQAKLTAMSKAPRTQRVAPQTTLNNLIERVNTLYPTPSPKPSQPKLTIGKINTQYGRGH